MAEKSTGQNTQGGICEGLHPTFYSEWTTLTYGKTLKQFWRPPGRLQSVFGGRYRDSRVFLAAAMLTLESFWGRVVLACYTGVPMMDSSSDEEDMPWADLLSLGHNKEILECNDAEPEGSDLAANVIAVIDSDSDDSMISDYYDDSGADSSYKPGLCLLLLCYDHSVDETTVG
ncbi:hypothetical protein PoB_001202600 [Plakobranchus ocellatus]|uniref:Uncharacterized protein n=1 Tax=Plakobranchus ocellatus TaxID=259542 RepID=A0AAV3YDY6_9GAST|nr:hypothetical protein PoB_001202600 [Plakobranchus ocellatus]